MFQQLLAQLITGIKCYYILQLINVVSYKQCLQESSRNRNLAPTFPKLNLFLSHNIRETQLFSDSTLLRIIFT